MIKFYNIIFVSLIILLAKSAFCAIDTEEIIESIEPVSVKSYGGNYIVIAPDTETAALYAKQAENIRKLVMKFFGDETAKTRITYIILKELAEDENKDDLWDVTILHGTSKQNYQGISKGRIEPAIRFSIVFYYILNTAEISAAANNVSIREEQIPLWICAGVIENLTVENRESYRNFIFDAVQKNEYLAMEKLFLHSGEFRTEQERALYYHQCGSLIDYLSNLPTGRKRILESIKRLWDKKDIAVSLMRHFDDEFSSVDELENNWISFVIMRKKKFFDFTRLSPEEIHLRLIEILKVEITTIDKKTIEESTEHTDFEGLMDHKNKTVRMNIALKKIAQLQDLKLRAPNEFQEMLDEYILSLQAIAEGKKRNFRSHYKKAFALSINLKTE